MIRKPYIFILLLSIAANSPLFSQSSSVYMPFISRLKVEPRGTSILLTWKDSSDIQGDYLIYRYTEEITEQNFYQATQIGIVSSGVQQYQDYPYDLQEYYYLILCRDDQQIYEQFVTFRNKTVTPVSAEFLAEETDRAASITGITVTEEGDYIRLEFENDKPERELMIYRSTEVLSYSQRILNATVISIQPGTKTLFKDYAVPGVTYYYGVFDADLIKAGDFVFNPGENITTRPIEIQLTADKITPETTLSRRDTPLPLLIISNQIDDGSPLAASIGKTLPEKQSISDRTRTLVDQIISWLPETESWTPEAVILEEENETDLTGAKKDLQEIIQNAFSRKEWLQAETELKLFLRTRRTEDVETRSRFYLGQCYYFQEKPEKALIEWLYIRSSLYQATTPWIDAVFKELKSKE